MTTDLMPIGALAVSGSPRLLGIGRAQGMQADSFDWDLLNLLAPPRWWLLVRGGKLPIVHHVQCYLPDGLEVVALTLEWQGLYYVGIHRDCLTDLVEVWGPYPSANGIAEQALSEYVR